MLATDGAGRVVDLNHAMARILGTAASAAIGRAASDVLAPAGDLASRMAAGTSGTFIELGGRQYAVRTTRYTSADLLLLVFRDFTEEIAAEREDLRQIAALRGGAADGDAARRVAWLRRATRSGSRSLGSGVTPTRLGAKRAGQEHSEPWVISSGDM